MLIRVRTEGMLTRQAVPPRIPARVATFHQVSLPFPLGAALRSGNHLPPDPLAAKGDTDHPNKATALTAGMADIKDSSKATMVEGNSSNSNGEVTATTSKAEEATMQMPMHNITKATTNSNREVKVKPPLTVDDWQSQAFGMMVSDAPRLDRRFRGLTHCVLSLLFLFAVVAALRCTSAMHRRR